MQKEINTIILGVREVGEDTHNKKHITFQTIEARGKTPMTKNIIVVDSQGKKHGTTYLKRAKGLVKQGRARFLTPTMLCLACPPNQNLEDNIMSEQTIDHITVEPETTTAEISASGDKYSMEYCLTQIEHIATQTEYLNQVLSELQQLENSSNAPKANALSGVVKCRETTNQQLLKFYEKMYDDLKTPANIDVVSHKVHLQEQLLKVMENTLENNEYSAKEVSDMFNGALDAIRHLTD